MESKIAKAVGLKHNPVAVVLSETKPEKALILANYGREGMENAIVPWAAGCQTIGILPYREAKSAKPREEARTLNSCFFMTGE